MFYCNIFCILFDIKDLIFLCVWSSVGFMPVQYVWVGHLHSSTWDVTKHRSQSPSPMGINWVSDRVGIDSTEYMCHKHVRFSGSLKQTTIIDF